jgi:hypothetical protein
MESENPVGESRPGFLRAFGKNAACRRHASAMRFANTGFLSHS